MTQTCDLKEVIHLMKTWLWIKQADEIIRIQTIVIWIRPGPITMESNLPQLTQNERPRCMVTCIHSLMNKISCITCRKSEIYRNFKRKKLYATCIRYWSKRIIFQENNMFWVSYTWSILPVNHVSLRQHPSEIYLREEMRLSHYHGNNCSCRMSFAYNEVIVLICTVQSQYF